MLVHMGTTPERPWFLSIFTINDNLRPFSVSAVLSLLAPEQRSWAHLKSLSNDFNIQEQFPLVARVAWEGLPNPFHMGDKGALSYGLYSLKWER